MVLLSSCATVVRTAYKQEVSNTHLIESPLMVDIEVDATRKVTASYRAYKGTEATAKEGALHEAMKQNGCDVIIHPYYEVKFYPKVAEANLTGFCGKYKAFRKPNLEDITLMQELVGAQPLFDPAFFQGEKKVVSLPFKK